MILLTGASGHLSSFILNKAAAAGLHVVAGSSTVRPNSTPTRRIDFDDPLSLDLEGIETLVLVSAGYGEDDQVIRRHENIISAAETQHVHHVIYTSLSTSGDHLAFALAHRWTERRLMRSDIGWTILRNGLYAELIAELAAPANGMITAPFGAGRISAVVREDLADAALTVMADPSTHAGRIYELSGTRSWGIDELARALDVQYAPLTLSEQRTHLSSAALLPFQPPMVMSIYSACAAGFLQTEHSDLPALLTNAPRDSLECAADILRAA